ncbi:hypothetical protein CNMCM5793_006121 [Aspergillus hiratsukae]|uniref:Fungal N-terminal domain-containing protein n=1 Tax=Aspergillus hiratsukae TaxID=1194566 RepID=A0A8H6UUE1_9EURO|nr:hypothetical protein CNMCM5793_006121 [Aspergillus hiratsukae]KAF7167292.1 hypothetical protein CNMCM6106_002895 [Aspergillus hiratsukae]
MSGLEILGIAASILQIADLGATVSVKLCTFYRQLKAADQSAQSLSSEVALTCSILRQLGENLRQDETTRLYSAQAFQTAQEVLRECEKVFRRISAAVDESRSDVTKNAIQRAARRLGFVLMERELDVLRGNLERLKSTMLLLLNVIMYAGQVRSRAESSVLQEQRELIRVLVEEKNASERRLDQLRRSDELVKALESLDTNHSGGSAAQDTLPPYEPLAQDDALRELRTYHQLVKRLLQEVDACKSGIERSRYSRIRNGVVRVHAGEVEKFQQAHGTIVTRVFEDPLFSLAPETDVPEVETHAEDKTEEAERLQRKEDIARRRPVKEVDTRRHRRFPPEPNRRDRLPLQEAGYLDADDFQIDSPTERSRINDRMRDYLPRSRAAFDHAPPPPAGIVDIEDDSRTTNRGANKNRKQRQEDTTMVDIESEDETILRRRRRRRASTSVSREVSPRHRRELMRQDLELMKQRMEIDVLERERARRRERENEGIIVDTESEDETILQNHRRPRREASPRHQRDYDLLADQRLLEKNDARQDLELRKQQMEIERLERELARRRGEHENGGITEVIFPWEGQSKTRTRQQIQTAQKQQSAPGSMISPSDSCEADVDVISVPAAKTVQEVKEAVDAVDDLLLKWTTLGQDDLLA